MSYLIQSRIRFILWTVVTIWTSSTQRHDSIGDDVLLSWQILDNDVKVLHLQVPSVQPGVEMFHYPKMYQCDVVCLDYYLTTIEE